MTVANQSASAPAPLVSVIIPTRNRAALLARSIASVLAQTWRDFELIVVNDASTDGTRELLASIADPRLRVLHRDNNKGAAAARNAGIALARGKYLGFQDDDDYWLAQKLEKQVAALEAAPPGVGWCLGGYIVIDGPLCFYAGGERFWKQLDYRRGLGPEGPDWSLIATPNWLVRREVLLGVGGFDERLRSWDDWELGLRLERATKRVHVDQPLFVQMRGGGMMRAELARASDMRHILEAHGALWAGDRRVLARHWYIVGRAESLYQPAPAGRAELWKSLRLNPLRGLTWAALAMSTLSPDLTRRWTERVRRLKPARP
jgi:glycosyltransferase involved in cell wall biosynthesis